MATGQRSLKQPDSSRFVGRQPGEDGPFLTRKPRAAAESAESGESGLGCEPSSGTGESGLGCEPSAESEEKSEEASEQSGLGCEPSADSEEESEEASKISGLRAISEPLTSQEQCFSGGNNASMRSYQSSSPLE